MNLETVPKPVSALIMDPISRIRRNHGLEHASLHILSQRYPRKPMAGHSDAGGFWIIGDIQAGEVQQAVAEALSRLQQGQYQLAVHPNCGTNFVTAGTLTGLAAGGAMFGAGPRLRDKFERLPLSILLATLALIFSQPLGNYLQSRVTTSGVPGALEVVNIKTSQRRHLQAHRVTTRG